MKKEKSLCQLMKEAYNISLDLVYTDIGTSDEESIISCWADGLMHKYEEDRRTGHCSLQTMVDFDPGKFEEEVKQDIAMMKRLLAKII